MKQKALNLSVPVIAGGVAGGLGVILLVGLLSGLVGRPNNCIKPTTTISTATPGPSNTASTRPSTTTVPFITNNRTLPASTTRPNNDRTTTPMFDFRLSDSVAPSKYDLLIRTYFEPYGSDVNSSPYTGEVSITFEVKEPTKKIEFHIDIEVELNKNNILIESVGSNQRVEFERAGYIPNQLFEVLTQNEITPGVYRMKLEFKGTTKNLGLYKAVYTENSQPRQLLATRFVPTYARTVFPCFDEPSFKAEYEITIEHPEDSFALSNFPEEKSESFNEGGKNRIRTKFQKTFKLSSYLVSFAVIPKDYDFKTTSVLDNREIRVYGRGSLIKEGLGELALITAKKSLEYFSEYFGINEVIPPKIFLLAVPDFYVDSSKNLGLSAFHEEFLLYSDKVNSLNDEILISKMIANELAHYWTGGYVTPSWWDDIWLNEGFSTFFEYQCLNEIFPEWDMQDQFINDHMVPIMWDDGFISSRPLKFEVSHPIEVAYAFEPLTISKSASVIRMLKGIVGEQKFKENIRKYLSANPFGVVTTYDFYAAFDLGDKIPTTTEDFVDRWLLQKNYPELTVLLETQNGKSKVNFIQSRFLLSPIQEEDPDLIDSPYGYKWEIYIECKAGGQRVNGQVQHTQGPVKEFEFFLSKDKDSYDLDKEYTWVKCNKDFTGFYVTEYKEELFEAFETLLMDDKDTFTLGDRSNIIHNSFELAFLGSKSYRIPNLYSVYLTERETSMIPFKTFTWHIRKIAKFIEHRASFKSLRGFMLEMIEEVIARLDLDLWTSSDDDQIDLLKLELLDLQCRMQAEKCLNKASEWFGKIPDDYFVSPNDPKYKNPVPANYRPIVYKYHMQNTYDLFDWVRMYEFYEATNNVREREYAIEALGNTRLLFLFDLYLSELLTNDLGGIKDDDIFNVIKSVGNNANGRYFAWFFMREYWNYLTIRFGQTREFSFIIKSISESFENIVLLEELDFFIETTYNENIDIIFKALDITVNNLYWALDKEHEFEQYFSGRGKLY